MNVSDLIYLLRQMDPSATVVQSDPTSSGEPAVSKLGRGEVQPIELGTFECNGIMVIEPWSANGAGGKKLAGPFPGVVLGEWK